MTSRNRTVLVGTDGSPAARAAVHWAANEARRRDTTLTVMCVFSPEPNHDGCLSERHPLDLDEEQAGVVLEGAEGKAHELSSGLPVRRVAVAGSPAPSLLVAARAAGIAVVGHRGRSHSRALLIGSVGQAVAAHARCPVAVVRGNADRSMGPVLVGVDPSPAGTRAVEIAFDQAGSRGCGLAAIRAFRSPWGNGPLPSTAHLDSELEAERCVLEEVLEPWRSKYPQVPVATRMSRFDAVHALTEASLGAQLVVIGAGCSGMVSSGRFGSVYTHLLRHADCPVLVADA